MTTLIHHRWYYRPMAYALVAVIFIVVQLKRVFP
jgi:hypothetical protein